MSESLSKEDLSKLLVEISKIYNNFYQNYKITSEERKGLYVWLYVLLKYTFKLDVDLTYGNIELNLKINTEKSEEKLNEKIVLSDMIWLSYGKNKDIIDIFTKFDELITYEVIILADKQQTENNTAELIRFIASEFSKKNIKIFQLIKRKKLLSII